MKAQFTQLDYDIEIQGRYQELIEKLSSLNGQVTPEEKHTIYNAVKTWALDLDASQISELGTLLKEKLSIPTTLFHRDLKRLEGNLKKIEQDEPKGRGKKTDQKGSGNNQERRAQSLTDGRICYRTNRGLLVADGSIIEDETSCPLYHFSTKGHIRFLDGERPKISDTYNQVVDRLSRHLIWKSPHHPKVVGLWIVGTYFGSIFTWYGYLWVTSPARRCGKSLLLELISLLSYNATPILTNPRPAYLYRTVDVNFPTVIIDELTKFKSDGGDDYSEVLSLLNAGAKSGSVVARMEKTGEKYEAKYYHAYSPKALAGLISLPDTLSDRSLRVDMGRKKARETIERLNLRKVGKELATLRDDLYLTGLEYDKDVTEFYDNSEKLDIPQELDDRLRDIVEPLFALAGVIDAEKGGLGTTVALKAYTLELAGVRSAEDLADSAQDTVRALLKLELGDNGIRVVPGKEIWELFKQEPAFDWCDTQKKAGSLLNSLGFYSHSHTIHGKSIRGYKINAQSLQDLQERYAEKEEGIT